MALFPVVLMNCSPASRSLFFCHPPVSFGSEALIYLCGHCNVGVLLQSSDYPGNIAPAPGCGILHTSSMSKNKNNIIPFPLASFHLLTIQGCRSRKFRELPPQTDKFSNLSLIFFGGDLVGWFILPRGWVQSHCLLLNKK